MSGLKEKAQIFIIGLSIGLLIAGAFFILKLDDYFKELNLYKKVSQTFTPAKDNSTLEQNPIVEKQKKNNSKTIKKANTKDSSDVKPAPDLSILSDTSKVMRTDSLNASFTATEDIIVKKDELLATKTMEVFNMNPTANKPSGKDSLLQKVSGISDERSTGKQMFNVEFWQSPLNYKGYKMSKYKIVVYGIASAEGLKLYKLDDLIYLKFMSNVYKLDYSGEFKPYERITDEQIINRLK
jgi:hypothetical protein